MESEGIAGLVLAAGEGRRMGRPKALVRDPHGTSWAARAARTLLDAGCDPVLVVIGAEAAAVREVLHHQPVQVVEAVDWMEGMGVSLRTGLTAMLEQSSTFAAVVVPVDLPDLSPDAVRRVAAEGHAAGLVRATYHGRPGHPVLLGRDHWRGVIDVAVGDSGARDYLLDYPPLEIECADLGGGTDVDTPAQLPHGHVRGRPVQSG